MPVEIEVQRISTFTGTPDNQQFQGWVEAALSAESGDFSLAIRVVDEAEARKFNRQYRDKDQATNILSFPAELPEGIPEEIRQSQLGDLLICATLVEKEAAEQNRPQADHWAHLVIHGVLHLLGYDHQETDEAIEMESLETRILAGLGVSDPYLKID